MKQFRLASTVCCVAILCATLAPSAFASTWNRKTVMTFSGPVEIPGVHLAGYGVLPAGTYVFKIMDSPSNRHIVQIFNKEETKVYATILAIPNYRLKPTDKTAVTFHERPAGQPEAIRAWFYPGRMYGEEFVYPKAKAMELAKTTTEPVPFTKAEVPAEVTEPIPPADTPVDAPVVAELKKAEVLAATPAGKEEPLAAEVTTPPVETALPATASPLAEIALFGFVALGGAIALGRAGKSSR